MKTAAMASASSCHCISVMASWPVSVLRAWRAVISILVYYGLFWLMCTQDAGWDSKAISKSFIDALYFGTAVMSTVGYGDVTPKSDEAKFVTVLLAFVGIFVVFQQVGWMVATFIFDPPIRFFRKHLARCLPDRRVRLKGFDGSTVELTVPLRASSYYARELAPVCILWIVLQLIFSALLCAAQAEGNDDGAPALSIGLAIYHTMITSTTVGFGDVPIATDAAKITSTLHILATVGLLASALSEAVRLHSERRTHINLVKLLLRKCDPTLMAELHDRYRAAAYEFEKHDAQARDEGAEAKDPSTETMDKATYVVAMLERLGPPATLRTGFCHAAERCIRRLPPEPARPGPCLILSRPCLAPRRPRHLGRRPSDDAVFRPARS